jgi:hypothetical protein
MVGNLREKLNQNDSFISLNKIKSEKVVANDMLPCYNDFRNERYITFRYKE